MLSWLAMRTILILRFTVLLASVGVVLAACGESATDADSVAPDDSLPTIVVTSSVLGDVVGEMFGEHADMVTLMPPGVDPHDFQPSAKQAAELTDADAIVVNGGGLEEGLVPIIEEAEHDGAAVCSALAGVTPLESEEADHTDEAHTHSSDAGGLDPHFFSDPGAMADAASHLVDCITSAEPSLDHAGVREHAAAYITDLRQHEEQMAVALAAIPPEQRVVVSDHNSFAYFADRYGFEVAGVISPGVSTHAEPSAADLAALAEVMRERDIRVIVSESSVSNSLARTLAGEVGGVEVVELHTETLAPNESQASSSYIDMIRGNVDALVTAFEASAQTL